MSALENALTEIAIQTADMPPFRSVAKITNFDTNGLARTSGKV